MRDESTDDDDWMDVGESVDRGCVQVAELRVGLTRPATFAGIPLGAFMLGMGGVAAIFLVTGNPFYLLSALPVYAGLRLVSARTPRIFDELAAWMRVSARCRNRDFWGAPSYSPRRTIKWEKW
ncbi:MAG: VirB3 family type IV secretion system protein [Telluria sp.]